MKSYFRWHIFHTFDFFKVFFLSSNTESSLSISLWEKWFPQIHIKPPCPKALKRILPHCRSPCSLFSVCCYTFQKIKSSNHSPHQQSSAAAADHALKASFYCPPLDLAILGLAHFLKGSHGFSAGPNDMLSTRYSPSTSVAGPSLSHSSMCQGTPGRVQTVRHTLSPLDVVWDPVLLFASFPFLFSSPYCLLLGTLTEFVVSQW